LSTDPAQIVAIPDNKIEILKEWFKAFSSGDIERIVELTHPDFEGVVPPELSAEPDTYRGHAGIRRYFESFDEVIEEVCFEPERFWDAGGDTVVVSVRMTGRGRRTSIPVEQRNAQVWTVRDGRLRSEITYASLPDALMAAGLPPQASEPAS
jgi:ketosteroid isomerase-like protein